jgi:hypothetical protein
VSSLLGSSVWGFLSVMAWASLMSVGFAYADRGAHG